MNDGTRDNRTINNIVYTIFGNGWTDFLMLLITLAALFLMRMCTYRPPVCHGRVNAIIFSIDWGCLQDG